MRHLLVTSVVVTAALWGGDSAIGTLVRGTNARSARVNESDMIGGGLDGSRVVLNGGTTVWLSPYSLAEFHADRMLLEKGGAKAELSGGYRIEAGQITVVPRGQSTALVGLLADGHLAVSAASGSLSVQSCGSTVVESIMPRQILEFAMQTSSSGTPPPPNSRSGAVLGACNCPAPAGAPKPKDAAKPCMICPSGELSVENGKLYVNDEFRGKIELQPPPQNISTSANNANTFANMKDAAEKAQKDKKPLRCAFCAALTRSRG